MSTTAPLRDALMLTYDATATITVTHTFDLVRELNTLSDGERTRYWTLSARDFANAGVEHEWERPIVWLLETDAMRWRISADADDIDDEDFHVRPGTSVPAGRWSEAAFLALCAAVPWLRPRDMVSNEDVARMPGPLDVPLDLGGQR